MNWLTSNKDALLALAAVIAAFGSVTAAIFGPSTQRSIAQRQIAVAAREAWMREFREQVAQFFTSVMRRARTWRRPAMSASALLLSILMSSAIPQPVSCDARRGCCSSRRLGSGGTGLTRSGGGRRGRISCHGAAVIRHASRPDITSVVLRRRHVGHVAEAPTPRARCGDDGRLPVIIGWRWRNFRGLGYAPLHDRRHLQRAAFRFLGGRL